MVYVSEQHSRMTILLYTKQDEEIFEKTVNRLQKYLAMYRKRLLLLCSGNLVIMGYRVKRLRGFSVDDDTVNVLNFELIN